MNPRSAHREPRSDETLTLAHVEYVPLRREQFTKL